MKKNISNINVRWIALVMIFFVSNVMTTYGQFQTVIGFGIPTNERSPGGLITVAGEYLVLSGNDNHPNGLYGIPDGDLQLDWLDNLGALSQQSRMYGQFYFDNAAWIEKAFCNNADAYIVASTGRKVMILSLVDINGQLIWSNSLGNITSNYVYTSACVKVDANGFFVLVGTRYDSSTGQNAVVVAQIDCNGTMNWNRVYILPGRSATATSVTAFDTSPGLQGAYYITGKIALTAGGDEEVFILKVGTNFGAFNFWKQYNISTITNDVGTCIQGSSAPAPNGGLWVSGYSDDINAVDKTALLLKTNLNGILSWANTYNIIGSNEYFNHFDFAANGKLALTGRASETTPFQGTLQGDCMLMRLDEFSGNTIDFTRMFNNIGFSSQGNRVAITSTDEYFVTGETVDLISPSVSATNSLAILTDNQGFPDSTCYYDAFPLILPQNPTVIDWPPPAITLDFEPDYNPIPLDTLGFNNQQKYCSTLPPDCDFTWITKNCFEVEFTGSIITSAPGNYTFEWDFDCTGPLGSQVNIVPTNTNTVSHIFQCGGGTFNVCLTITDPFGFQCSVMQTIVVPNTCCGQIDSTSIACTADTNTYAFSVTYSNPLAVGGVGSCSYTLTSSSGTIVPSSLLYTPVAGNPGGVIVSGLIFVPNIIPLNLNFALQSNCICNATGLPITCNLPFSIPTICCKEILVNDHIVCKDGIFDSIQVQVSFWPPLSQVYSVSWFVMPKPPSGICPPPPYTLYQSNLVTNTLTPLQLFPNQLPGDLCVYAEVLLDDGPCKMLQSNLAMVQLCTPDSCVLSESDSCYFGTCIVPGQISLSLITHPDSCLNLIEWFEPNNPIPVQVGGLTYQPTICLSMANDQKCFEDFFFRVDITDKCGKRSCFSRFRLYSNNAPKGTLVLDPAEPQFFCPYEDATLKFTPGCIDEPKMWSWYSSPYPNGTPTLIPDAGTMNPLYNTNELTQSIWYSVVSQNGVCPADTVDLSIEVKDPLAITSFSAFSDPCVEQFVTMDLDFLPCTISGSGASCNCTYTINWYKDGSIIGTTPATPPSASFTYTTPPLYGNYYAVLTADCCPDELAITQVITFDQACEPTIIGPCFICDNDSVLMTANMVMPPIMPCLDFCTLEWFDGSGNSLGTGPSIYVTQAGQYSLVSDCNGCIKTVNFNLLPCQSSPCGPVSIEELLPEEESPVHLFPNPTNGAFTIEWLEGALYDTRIFITNQNGTQINTYYVPLAAKRMEFSIVELPPGIYFIKIQSNDKFWTVAKLVKE